MLGLGHSGQVINLGTNIYLKRQALPRRHFPGRWPWWLVAIAIVFAFGVALVSGPLSAGPLPALIPCKPYATSKLDRNARRFGNWQCCSRFIYSFSISAQASEPDRMQCPLNSRILNTKFTTALPAREPYDAGGRRNPIQRLSRALFFCTASGDNEKTPCSIAAVGRCSRRFTKHISSAIF